MSGHRVAITGATGLVGAELLQLLVASSEVEAVLALGRRAPALSHAKLRAETVAFDDAAALAAALLAFSPTEACCALGTTIKKAGSQQAFRAVDHDAPLAFAQAALAAGAQGFAIVTAVGADAGSAVFYSRVKGELEQKLNALLFPRGVKLLHPSIILGERAERRPAERVGMLLMGATRALFAGPLAKYRAIDSHQLAKAVYNAALREPAGNQSYEGKALFALAEA